MTGLDTLAAMAREKKQEMEDEERSQANSSENTSTEKSPAVVQSATKEQPILPSLEGAAASALQHQGITQQQLQAILASGALGGGAKGISQQQALALMTLLQANPSTAALAMHELQQQLNNFQYLQALQQRAQIVAALRQQAGGVQGASTSSGGPKQGVCVVCKPCVL
jgi:hypothetical protein